MNHPELPSPRHPARSSLLYPLLTAMTLLAACATPPPTAAPTLRAEVPMTADAAATGAWPGAEWWQGYGDATLTALEQRALKEAPGMAIAAARFDLAGQQLQLARAGAGVKFDPSFSAERQRLSDHGLLPPEFLGFHWYDQFDVGVRARYSFDWWGEQRAAIAAALDSAHASEADAAGAALQLSAAVADTYFAWQADQQRTALADERLALAEHGLRIAQDRLKAGVDGPEVARRAELARAAAADQQAAQQGAARLRLLQLAALVGCSPAELPAMTAQALPTPQTSLPANASLDLVARRPDISASRWRIEAALQNVHAARARFLPDLSLNALAGLSSIELSHLLDINSRAPSFGLALHLPLFDTQTLRAQHSARQSELRAAVATYDQTLLDAARQVAGQISLRQQLDQRVAARNQALAAAAQNLKLARDRLQRGTADRRVELDAQLTELDQRAALLELRAAAVSADVGLIQALGGGYQIPGSKT